jgi:hypothetical protein
LLLAWNFIGSTPLFVTTVAATIVLSLWLNRFVVWTEKR